MSSTASGREVYVLGKKEWNNREVVIVEDGVVHDFPADAKYPYSSQNTKFPYDAVV
jgi:hypothetical protein